MLRRSPVSPVPVAASLRFLLPLLALCLALSLSACSEGFGSPSEEEVKVEVQALLEKSYCPKLGEAYAAGDASLISAFTVPKEVLRITRRIEELAGEGKTYEPIFRQVTVESVSTWNYSNAFATTVEVWDVSSYTTGSRQLLNQQLGQRSRVKYQLKRQDSDRTWVVLYRELAETL